jgi:serine/threonine protein phosphatase PrpC
MTELGGWKIGGASVSGFSHIEEDIPCQDAHAYNIREGGWLIAAVADGAGSARLSHIGSKAFVDDIVENSQALDLTNEFEPLKISEFLIKSVNDTSLRLLEEQEAKEDSEICIKSDFAATLVVVFANSEGGAFFHVGDGAGIAIAADKSVNTIITKPQNGEYANETYFITMENWDSYLRVTNFGSGFDTILLMSDGVTPMAMTKGCAGPFNAFVDPVIGYLREATPADADAALIGTLSNKKVRSVTGDDKTLVWAVRPSDQQD